ncbi:methyltransferase [Nonomuraea sp. KM90]|uniref:methyltransferase n=1 Tax=Nonomuraea sp. KM90 TaxID=3457428 RepID=UPI003FCED921
MEHAIVGGADQPVRHSGETLRGWLDELPPDLAEVMVAQMSGRSAAAAALLAERPLGHVMKVFDVGGDGVILAALLQRHPRLHGWLLNQRLPAEAGERLRREDMAERCQATTLDVFHGRLPCGYRPLYVLDTVLCQLGDDLAERLLQRIAAGMAGVGSAELWLVEPILPEPPTAHSSVVDDLVWMAVTAAGRARTLIEHGELLRRAGWPDVEQVPLDDEQGLIVARLPRPR